MAKGGNKLTKLKSAMKRWPSFTKLSRSNSSIAASATDDDHIHNSNGNNNNNMSKELHAVYVGKSRRRYLVSSDIVEHPVFQELVERSCYDNEYGIVVACEVVLFEHLLWMLENNGMQLGSVDELAEYYTC